MAPPAMPGDARLHLALRIDYAPRMIVSDHAWSRRRGALRIADICDAYALQLCKQRLSLAVHAVLHVIAPLEKVDGRVFLLGLRLALRLKLRRPGFFGGRLGRDDKRAGQQAGRNDADYRFHGKVLL
jgi:hypothetical protein